VGVRAGIGLGDREGHDRLAARDRGYPPLPLLLRPETADHGAADRRRDNEHQERAAEGRELLRDGGELADAEAAAAVLLGQVHPDEAGRSDGLPQLRGLLAARRPLGVVLVPELGADRPDRLPDELELGDVGGGHDC
jgi:hypothetical protein